jgi:hypothetical protein
MATMLSILETNQMFRQYTIIFRNQAMDFVENYPEDDEWRMVARTITEILQFYAEFDLEDDQHPFQRFAKSEHSMNLSALKSTLEYRVDVQNPQIRSVIQAFFTHNGSQRESLDELMTNYYSFNLSVLTASADQEWM